MVIKSYPGEHDAIVPKALWDKVQQIFIDGTSRKRNQETHEVKALLRGIIRCGHCHKSMICSYTKKKSKVYRYYTCGGAIKNGYSTCPVRSIPAGEIEKAVIDQLRAILRSPEMVAQTFRAAHDIQEEELQELRDKKADLEMRMVELKAAANELVSADDGDNAYSEKWSELNDEIQGARNTLVEIDGQISRLMDEPLTEQDVVDALRKLDPIWNELYPSEQHRIFKALVDSVVVTSDGLDIRLKADGVHSVVAELKGDERTCTV